MEQIRRLLVDAGLPPSLVPYIIGLLAVQLVLQVVAFVDLARRPHVTIGDRKWVWALIILFGESIGAILYFALGRVPYASAEERSRPVVDMGAAEERAQSIVDKLYGSKGADSGDKDRSEGGR